MSLRPTNLLAVVLLALTVACTPDQTDSPPPQVNGATLTVAEHRPVGALVGTLTATVAEGRTGTFRLAEGDEDGVFALDAIGRLTVANAQALDFERSPSFTLEIEVTDDASPPATGSAQVTVRLTDVNEAPTLEDMTFNLSEKAVEGAIVGTLVVTEPDARQIHAFAIVDGNIGDTFAVGATGGILTVASTAMLDFETTPSFTLTVRVTDSGTPFLWDEATVTVNLVDKNDPPVLDGGPFTLDEHAAEGSLVGTLSVVDDGDEHTFEFLGGNTGGAFGLDASTGAVVVVNPLALDFEVTPVFRLSVRVTDAEGLSAEKTVTVSLNDVNEAPTLSGGPFTVVENSAGNTVVGALTAADVDAGQTTTLAIVGGNDLEAFALSGRTLVVANKAALDFETRSTFELTVRATDNGSPPASSDTRVVVQLVDLNEAPALHDAALSVNENSPPGQQIGVLTAVDPDEGQSLLFELTAGNDGGAFALHATTGALTVADGTLLDFESRPTFTLSVRVTDDGIPALSANSDFTVSVGDVEEPPTFTDVTFTISENAANGTLVGLLTASAPADDATVTFALEPEHDGVFALSPNGRLTVADSAALDFETSASFTLPVRATGDDGLSAPATVTVQLQDVNEAPALSADRTSVTVPENKPAGWQLVKLTAKDEDAGQTVSLEILSGNTGAAFALFNGWLVINDVTAFDYETTPSFSLTLRATDDASPALHVDLGIAVQLQDVNEAPVVTAGQTFSVASNATVGQTVGHVAATDPDAGQSLTWKFTSGQTTQGYFGIEASTGRVYIATLSTVDGPLSGQVGRSHSLSVRAMDDGSPGATSDGSVSVTVTNPVANEPPMSGSLSFVAYTDGPYTMNLDEQASLGTPRSQVVTFGGGSFQSNTYPAGTTAGLQGGSLKVDADGTISVASQYSGTLDFTVKVANAAGSANLQVSIVFCVALEPGGVVHYYQRPEVCLKGGAEYVFVPTNLTESTTSGSGAVNVTVKATGVVPVAGAPSPFVTPFPGPLALTPNGVQAAVPAIGQAAKPVRDDSFDEMLRRQEKEVLEPLMARARAESLAGPNLSIVPGVPAVGAFMTLNTASEACTAADNRTARVMAVSAHAIVMDEWRADKSAPVVANGFSTAQFQEIAQRFDNEIWPVISSTFGMPTDIDGNGRIVIFYTSAVNQLTPRGSGSYTGGFVHSRDVYPKAACATSNAGEMFYMLSPDPDGLFSDPKTVEFVREGTFGILAHEFQHLINASRRLHVNGAPGFETVWLNEGLSHVAEELMFHVSAGTTPGQNIGLNEILASQAMLDAFNGWAISNFGRLSSWLESPHTQGPYAPNDTLATRGAIWAFLRYAADRKGGDQSALWSALVNSTTEGLANLDAVLEDNTTWWVSDFTQAMYLDDTGLVVEPRYTQPSWNFRSIYPAFRPGYPLAVRDAVNGVATTIPLAAGGGSAYVRLGVAAGELGILSMLSNGVTPPATVELSLIRRR